MSLQTITQADCQTSNMNSEGRKLTDIQVIIHEVSTFGSNHYQYRG